MATLGRPPQDTRSSRHPPTPADPKVGGRESTSLHHRDLIKEDPLGLKGIRKEMDAAIRSWANKVGAGGRGRTNLRRGGKGDSAEIVRQIKIKADQIRGSLGGMVRESFGKSNTDLEGKSVSDVTCTREEIVKPNRIERDTTLEDPVQCPACAKARNQEEFWSL